MRTLLVVGRRLPLALAALALLVAAGGVGYAAGTVGSADIIDNSVQSIDLRDGAAVTGVDVVNDSITGADVRESTLVGIAHAVLYDVTSTSSPVFTPVLTLAGMAFDAACVHLSGGNEIELRKRGPAVIVETDERTTMTASGGTEHSATAFTLSRGLPAGAGDIIHVLLSDGFFEREVGTWYVHWTSHVAVLQLNSIDSAAATHSCLIDGTITLGA